MKIKKAEVEAEAMVGVEVVVVAEVDGIKEMITVRKAEITKKN